MNARVPTARGKEGVRKGSGSRALTKNNLRPIPLLKRMRDARSTRLALRLSLAQMGERLGAVHPNPVLRGANGGHGGKPYAKQTVSQWENRGSRKKYRMTDETREAYVRVVQAVVAQRSHRALRVRATLGRRAWRFDALTACAGCGAEFVMQRSNARRCEQCRRHSGPNVDKTTSV